MAETVTIAYQLTAYELGVSVELFTVPWPATGVSYRGLIIGPDFVQPFDLSTLVDTVTLFNDEALTVTPDPTVGPPTALSVKTGSTADTDITGISVRRTGSVGSDGLSTITHWVPCLLLVYSVDSTVDPEVFTLRANLPLLLHPPESPT